VISLTNKHILGKVLKKFYNYHFMKRFKNLVFWLVVFFSLTITNQGIAKDLIKTSGNLLELILPLASAGKSLYQEDFAGFLELTKSLALTIGTTYFLKNQVRETRPNGKQKSFPSGHTAISFSAASFVRVRYGWKESIPFYLAAGFVAFSRIESKEHHLHDVVAGALIGELASLLCVKPFKQHLNNSSLFTFYFYPHLFFLKLIFTF